MSGVITADPHGSAGWCATQDEHLAAQSAARLLITAATGVRVETIARRIHAASSRTMLPFVCTSAYDWPSDPALLRATWTHCVDAAQGGSLLMNDIELLAPFVQDQLIEVLEELQLARTPASDVRLVSGTTVLLFHRVGEGRFSERLFYLLNVLHVVADDASNHGLS